MVPRVCLAVRLTISSQANPAPVSSGRAEDKHYKGACNVVPPLPRPTCPCDFRPVPGASVGGAGPLQRAWRGGGSDCLRRFTGAAGGEIGRAPCRERARGRGVDEHWQGKTTSRN